MCIFYTKKLICTCEIIAARCRIENNCIILSNHTYKWICDKCIKLSDEEIYNRLHKIINNKNYNKIYGLDDHINYCNGWIRTASSPIDYTMLNDNRIFGIDYV